MWAVAEHFRDYLIYPPIVEVYTDNNPLFYVLLTNILNTTGQRWANEHHNIHYKAGRIKLI